MSTKRAWESRAGSRGCKRPRISSASARWPYWRRLSRHWRVWRPFHAEIAFDGSRERLRAVQLTVANSHRFGGVISVGRAAIDDGRLDLYCGDIDTFGQAPGFSERSWPAAAGLRPGLRTLPRRDLRRLALTARTELPPTASRRDRLQPVSSSFPRPCASSSRSLISNRAIGVKTFRSYARINV